MKKTICEKCINDCDIPCAAMEELYKINEQLKTEEKKEIIKELRKELNIQDYETDKGLEELARSVIEVIPQLGHIKEFIIKIGYVRSYYPKRNGSKLVYADCRKVKGAYSAYIPFDFLITFYEPNVCHMTNDQLKILML